MKKIGFIGVGIMGKSMVRNLRKAGYEVAIYTRTKAKAEDVIAEGAVWCDTAAECAKGRDVVITIVGYPKDVEEVYFGDNGIIANADPGTYVIDMTTTSPRLAVRIWEEAEKAGIHAVDAPVTGGDTGAKAGTLTILAGGKKEDFDACVPVFEAMGKNINYEGKAGNGQHTKMCNQIAIAGALAGLGGGLLYLAGSGNGIQVVDTLAAEGFNGIPVALLAMNNPIGIIFSGIFIAYLKVGGDQMQLYNFVPEVIDIIISVIIYFSAFALVFRGVVSKVFSGKKTDTADKTA
jgi:3-hydroxyisobutyrate dehydrogenase-like beta-hydroxyacid dehydrogenase